MFKTLALLFVVGLLLVTVPVVAEETTESAAVVTDPTPETGEVIAVSAGPTTEETLSGIAALGDVGTELAQLFAGAEKHYGTLIDSRGLHVGLGASLPMTDLASLCADIPVLGPVTRASQLYGVWPGLTIESSGDVDVPAALEFDFGFGMTGHARNTTVRVAGMYYPGKLGQGADGGERHGLKKLAPHGLWLSLVTTLQ